MRDGSVDIFGPRNQIYNKIHTKQVNENLV